MKCTECPDYIKCQRNYDLRRKRHRCLKAKEPKVYTNANRIRSMTDEELAELLLDGCRGSFCDEQAKNEYGSVDCFQCRLNWLQQPCEDSPTVEKG